MGTMPKSLRGARALREQVVLGACLHCGSARVVMPCSNVDCDHWFAVCDCNDVSETSYSAGDRCHECRSLPSELPDAYEARHPTPRTARGTYLAHRASTERRASKGTRSTKGGF